MKTFFKTVLIAGAMSGLAVASASAQMALPRNFNLSKESRLWFDGTSTVRSFTCSAKKIDANVVAQPDASPIEMAKTAGLVVPVAQLDCGNGKINEHMRNALKAEHNPQIPWKLASHKAEGKAI